MKTNRFVKIYDLKKDRNQISQIQDATINTKDFGLKIEKGLFGSKEWWFAIKEGRIQKTILEGIVTRLYMSGHNDFPEVEVTSGVDKTKWERLGEDKYYKVGKKIRITYVKQEFKKPILDIKESRVILSIEIEK